MTGRQDGWLNRVTPDDAAYSFMRTHPSWVSRDRNDYATTAERKPRFASVWHATTWSGAVWDTNMNTQASVGLLGQAGVRMMRYPGGSYGDGYHWQTHTVSGGGYIAPGTDFDSFMHTTQAIGAQAILIANYGSGTPQEAAGWVQYANVTKNYAVKYWEIGNELFGNGYYGANWELDYHDSKSATTYANNVVQYAKR
jgi:hypothetical protein